MPYKLYTDKNENFECEIAVKNASLKGSIARLMVESNGLNIAFNGKIVGDKCVIPIKRLKGLLEENTVGKMHLEVVVEDTYFKPWEDSFIVEEHTSVKVVVNEQQEFSGKPIVEVKVPSSEPKKPSPKTTTNSVNLNSPLREISTVCGLFDVRKETLSERKQDFTQILKEYFRANPQYNIHRRAILGRITNLLN